MQDRTDQSERNVASWMIAGGDRRADCRQPVRVTVRPIVSHIERLVRRPGRLGPTHGH